MFRHIRAAAMIAAGATSVASGAITYSFNPVNGGGGGVGVPQLSVTVVDHAPGQVAFTIANAGPASGSVTGVYFQAPSFTSIATIVNGSGVNFAPGGSPRNLPGGNSMSPAFVTTTGLLASAVASPIANGVQPGEWVTVVLNLAPTKTFQDVIGELNSGVHARVGVRVQGMGGDQGGSHVTPAPGACVLGVLGGLVAVRRRV